MGSNYGLFAIDSSSSVIIFGGKNTKDKNMDGCMIVTEQGGTFEKE